MILFHLITLPTFIQLESAMYRSARMYETFVIVMIHKGTNLSFNYLVNYLFIYCNCSNKQREIVEFFLDKSCLRKFTNPSRISKRAPLSKALFIKNENKNQQERHALPRTGFPSNFSKTKATSLSATFSFSLVAFQRRVLAALSVIDDENRDNNDCMTTGWPLFFFSPLSPFPFLSRVYTEPKETECFQVRKSARSLFFLPFFLLFLFFFFFFFFFILFSCKSRPKRKI